MKGRLLLHACCGPCLLEPYDALAVEYEVNVVYANPNIHPEEEYERRRDTLFAYAGECGIEVMELPYDASAWTEATRGLDRPDRCRACFRLRLGMTARVAAARGYDEVATTLSVSPYQDHEALRDAGREVCRQAGVGFLETDFRDCYPEAVRRSRELGMYRQSFCGCAPSAREAEEERAKGAARALREP